MLTSGLQDKLGWNPIMAATKADSGGEELVEMFLGFLETRIDNPDDWDTLLEGSITRLTLPKGRQLLRPRCWCGMNPEIIRFICVKKLQFEKWSNSELHKFKKILNLLAKRVWNINPVSLCFIAKHNARYKSWEIVNWALNLWPIIVTQNKKVSLAYQRLF